MPREDAIDCSTIGVSRQYHNYYATCWPCNRVNVPADVSLVPPEKSSLRLKPRCLRCGRRGEWTIIPKCTVEMRPSSPGDANR